jgi:hypothetical protein
MTSYNLPVSTMFTSPAKLDSQLFQYITDYVAEFSFVKLEAALIDMVYMQFKNNYEQANDEEKGFIEKQILQYIPTRQQLRDYLAGEAICFRRANTLANFFKIPYTLHNHNPACDQTLS